MFTDLYFPPALIIVKSASEITVAEGLTNHERWRRVGNCSGASQPLLCAALLQWKVETKPLWTVYDLSPCSIIIPDFFLLSKRQFFSRLTQLTILTLPTNYSTYIYFRNYPYRQNFSIILQRFRIHMWCELLDLTSTLLPLIQPEDYATVQCGFGFPVESKYLCY